MGHGPLDGKTAIVTGAGRGIGRAIALGLSAAGATVVGTAWRHPEELTALAADAPGRIVPIHADVADPAHGAAVVDAALTAEGVLHTVVNNAALGVRHVNPAYRVERRPFWAVDPDRWVESLRANVEGVFHMSRLAVPHLVASGAGCILLISVNDQTMRRPGFSPYGPSKAALEALADVWHGDLQGTGVRVNVLAPGGATDTGMIPPDLPAAARADLLAPEIMAEPAVWLATGTADGQRVVANGWRNPEITTRQR